MSIEYVLTFKSSAASAIAANTVVRSFVASIFPLFSTYMFDGMGVQWACTLLGCIAAAFVPVPLVFYLYGAKIRARSKFANALLAEEDDELQEKLED
jgi:DHA1 family multidrug resistance protein-like MFS transporter